MKLTALEIKQQQFEKSLRGYDTAEVHSFLNLVASEWEHLVARIRELEQNIEKLNEKLKHYERVEAALHETLQTAKDSAEHKLDGARKDAKNLIEKAEMEADAIINEANHKRQEIRQGILRLIDRREEIIGNIKSYLDMAQESLQQFSRDEASLFTLPQETGAASKTSGQNKTGGKSENTKKDSPAIPKNLDDILDELD